MLLPNVNATPVTILAFWRIGKVPAILNYTTGTPMMQTCSELAGLKQIVTSRAFLEKAGLDIEPMKKAGIEFIYLEDVREQVSGLAKLAILLKHKAALGQAQFNIPAEQTAVVLFTSGSEGIPKGVELTHRNILANLRQVQAMVDIMDKDSIFNCLPMFHSFGLVVGTLLPFVPRIADDDISVSTAIPRYPKRHLPRQLHTVSQHQHLPQRLRQEGPSVRFPQRALPARRGGKGATGHIGPVVAPVRGAHHRGVRRH